jgi:hypothetical protein
LQAFDQQIAAHVHEHGIADKLRALEGGVAAAVGNGASAARRKERSGKKRHEAGAPGVAVGGGVWGVHGAAGVFGTIKDRGFFIKPFCRETVPIFRGFRRAKPRQTPGDTEKNERLGVFRRA